MQFIFALRAHELTRPAQVNKTLDTSASFAHLQGRLAEPNVALRKTPSKLDNKMHFEAFAVFAKARLIRT
jgi:hypothetical protein